ncbi:MAG: hypothetical protein WBB24_18440 [Maribacter sp.]
MSTKKSRRKFIQTGGLALAGTFLSQATYADGVFSKSFSKKDNRLMEKLIANNDKSTGEILKKGPLDPRIILNSFRSLASSIAILSASISCSKSKHYQSEEVLTLLEGKMDIMLNGQYEDGTVDAGGNRQSPPDTAFVLEHICAAATVLKDIRAKSLVSVKEKLRIFILNAGEAMVTGGVHTPNHRWVISAALANINALYPDPKYVKRIHEWLAEGVFIDEDGHYLERSGVYSAVIDKAFITISRLLDMPELLDAVSKNLTMYYYYTEPNGDVISLDSRRQDQLEVSNISKFYLQYRYMAILTENPLFIYQINKIESLPDFEQNILSKSLIAFMEEPILQKELPSSANVSQEFEKFFSTSHLARIRYGDTAITIFGGTDKPVQIISGKSSNPNFMTFAKGNAILNYMRLSTSFFRMGYFRSDGLEKIGQTYTLKETKEAYYYQPMSAKSRKADGDYDLSASPDGRFWNKMDFDSREKSNIKEQVTVIEIIENDGVVNLEFKVDGPPNVEVTIEMCFKEGGDLAGVETVENNDYLLQSGFGTYTMGTDTVTFGPGKNEHRRITNLESEQYTYHQGSLRLEGMHVYITGYTPFIHKMTIS